MLDRLLAAWSVCLGLATAVLAGWVLGSGKVVYVVKP
jgi:hypothetical protein